MKNRESFTDLVGKIAVDVAGEGYCADNHRPPDETKNGHIFLRNVMCDTEADDNTHSPNGQKVQSGGHGHDA